MRMGKTGPSPQYVRLRLQVGAPLKIKPAMKKRSRMKPAVGKWRSFSEGTVRVGANEKKRGAEDNIPVRNTKLMPHH